MTCVCLLPRSQMHGSWASRLHLQGKKTNTNLDLAYSSETEKSLSELYFLYKRATKIVLDWLVSTVGYEKFRQSRPSTTKTVSAAAAACDQGLAFPEYVLSKFREALVKRREVYGLYIECCSSANHEENLKHRAFIER